MSSSEEPRDSYWDLMRDIAQLQAHMGEDLVGWAMAYKASGRAFQHSAETLRLMADAGERMERYLQSGPPDGVQQALRLLTSPWQFGEAAPAVATLNPFQRFWEPWAAANLRAGSPEDTEGGGRNEPG